MLSSSDSIGGIPKDPERGFVGQTVYGREVTEFVSTCGACHAESRLEITGRGIFFPSLEECAVPSETQRFVPSQ